MKQAAFPCSAMETRSLAKRYRCGSSFPGKCQGETRMLHLCAPSALALGVNYKPQKPRCLVEKILDFIWEQHEIIQDWKKLNRYLPGNKSKTM
jgi:hypothetical protein